MLAHNPRLENVFDEHECLQSVFQYIVFMYLYIYQVPKTHKKLSLTLWLDCELRCVLIYLFIYFLVDSKKLQYEEFRFENNYVGTLTRILDL